MKEVTKDNAEIICYKANSEGFDYCFTEYSDWIEETKGTDLEQLILNYQDASEKLKEKLNELREKYDIESED